MTAAVDTRPRHWLIPALLALLAALVMRPPVKLYTIVSGSMVPTLLQDDVVAAAAAPWLPFPPRPGDVVMLRLAAPLRHALGVPGNPWIIKRLQGVAGDVIELRAGTGMYRNGALVAAEPWAGSLHFSVKVVGGNFYHIFADGSVFQVGQEADLTQISDTGLARTIALAPAEPLAQGQVFVLGDDPGSSLDSITFGPLDARSIRGRALAVIYPWSRAGLLGPTTT
jgi:signal peptidase I